MESPRLVDIWWSMLSLCSIPIQSNIVWPMRMEMMDRRGEGCTERMSRRSGTVRE